MVDIRYGDINPELNSYLITFEEAVKMVFGSLEADEFEEYLIYVHNVDLRIKNVS